MDRVYKGKRYDGLEQLIQDNLDKNEEYKDTQALIDEMAHICAARQFSKPEFLKMAKWKSPRPIQHYEKNSDEDVLRISKDVFNTPYEKRRIQLLDGLSGVSIPVASAILMLTDPQKYGVIDIRVWQLLHYYGSVNKRASGKGFDSDNWYSYLTRIRYFANKFGVKARDIERTLFIYDQEHRIGNLYKTSSR